MIMREFTVRPRFQRATAMLLTSAFVLALAACGGGGGSSPAPQQPSPLPTPPTIPPLATGPAIGLFYGQTVGNTRKWADSDSATGGIGQTVDGIPCGPMSETYHVHAHVSIFLNGDQLIVPKWVGLPPPTTGTRSADGFGTCAYVTHTHDETGEIHVEAAAQAVYTLGQLFDVWGQPLDMTNVNVGGIVGLPIKVYVIDQGDTAATDMSSDPKNIELKAHRQITIQIGTALSAIPVYDFEGA